MKKFNINVHLWLTERVGFFITTTWQEAKHKIIAVLGLETLLQAAYTSDIAPSDCHLFRSLQHFPDGNECINYKGVQMAVEEYFISPKQN
ncbi:hypothetical protein TNCV_2905271 [Trichonephila clavipes]|nr:hypothetical protein TNCV_2905271 [Trichonephila clavipes]